MKAGLLALVVLAVAVLAAGAEPPDQAALVAHGQRLFSAQGCYGCHLVGRFGTAIGPNLSHVGGRYSEEYLRRWLLDPAKVRPAAHMPKLDLEPAEAGALAAWLATLK